MNILLKCVQNREQGDTKDMFTMIEYSILLYETSCCNKYYDNSEDTSILQLIYERSYGGSCVTLNL